MKETIKLRSGATVTAIRGREAQTKNYLTRTELARLHLSATHPVAFEELPDGVRLWFDPETVKEADPDLWYAPDQKREKHTLSSGTVIERMSTRRAATLGFFTKDRLLSMKLEVIEEPVAFSRRADGSLVFFYDKATTVRMPLLCVKCGKDIRYRKKLCRACYEEEMAVRRTEGNAHRARHYGMERSRVLFFDLELTGFYDRDEIISISICDANGNMIMNTLVRPTHTKRWKKTEKIHGITPEMTADAPTLEELTPQIKEIFANADRIIAYGVSTDFSHIKYIYPTDAERKALWEKIRCCANEFVRYIHECRPDVEHASLTDAMACLEIAWDGIAHTSIADTIGCMKVWEKLFPNYYIETGEADPEPEPPAAKLFSDTYNEQHAEKDADGELDNDDNDDENDEKITDTGERSTLFDIDLYALAADDGEE